MAEQFAGTYKFVSQENFEEFLKKTGAPYLMRKMAGHSKPTVEIHIEGDKWTITTHMMKTITVTFCIGEEVEETTPRGVFKSTFTIEDGKLRHIQKATKPADKDCEFIREIVGDELHMTLICEDVEAKRVFKRE